MREDQNIIAQTSVKRRHLVGGAALGLAAGAIGGLAGGVALGHAAALPQQKPSGKRRFENKVVLVTGGVGTHDTVSESEVGRRYLAKAGLPETAVVALPAGASTAASLAAVAHWLAARGDGHRVLLVSDGFHMLRLRIIASRLGLLPFTSPAPGSPIRANPRRNATYFLAEGVKVPITWLFNH